MVIIALTTKFAVDLTIATDQRLIAAKLLEKVIRMDLERAS